MAKKKAVRRKKVAAGIGRADAGRNEGRRRRARSTTLAAQVEDDGGAVLGRYNDPFGGKPLLLVALPVAIASSRRRTSAIRPTRTSSG